MAAVPFACVEVVLEAVKRALAARFAHDPDAYCAIKAPAFDRRGAVDGEDRVAGAGGD